MKTKKLINAKIISNGNEYKVNKELEEAINEFNENDLEIELTYRTSGLNNISVMHSVLVKGYKYE